MYNFGFNNSFKASLGSTPTDPDAVLLFDAVGDVPEISTSAAINTLIVDLKS